jgi:hypothetical protein
MVVFTDICAFHFSILVSVDARKYSLVRYTSKHGVAHNLTLHSRHLNVIVSASLAEHTHQRILLHCISQCLVSSLFGWLVDGACLVVKILSGEGSSLVWGRNPLGPPVKLKGHRHITSTFYSDIPLYDICASNTIRVTARQKWRQSPGLTPELLSVTQASAVPRLSQVIALRGGGITH